MPNLIWPRTLKPNAGPSGLLGRTVHWLGVALAAAFLLAAVGFAVDGWSISDAIWLSILAVAMALGARGVRFLLAQE